MIRSDCIHLAGYEQYDERYCSHSSRCEFITTCAGCDLYERVMTPTDVLLLKVDDLTDENAKLRELVIEQRKLAKMRVDDAVRVYLLGGSTSEQFDALMKATARMNRLSNELGIEVD